MSAEKKPVSFRYGEIEYKDVRVVDRRKMKGLALRDGAAVEAARGIQVCPVTAREFPKAALHFPIVFTPTDNFFPVVILSLSKGKNPFVDGEHWKSDVYAPAAIRRYPFIMGEADDNGRRPLCVDHGALEEAKNADQGFFSDGNDSEAIQSALKLCEAFQTDSDRTQTVCAALDNAGLLKSQTMNVTGSDGKKRSTGAFKMIDTERLADMDEASVVSLHKSGVMGLIHAHLISLGHITKIATIS